jgi:plastocyanin
MRILLRLAAVILCLAADPRLNLAQTLPAPTTDRVGFPEGYRSWKQLFAFDRPDNRQVRVIYGNAVAAQVRPDQPFFWPYGSVLVMETWRARQDSAGVPILDENGRFVRDALTGIFVMRKEGGFGVDYRENRTGEWEYVAYREDRTHQTTPQNSGACAACHVQAGQVKDWVFRASLFFHGGSGAVPDGVIQHYKFLPGTTRIPLGSAFTLYNSDEVEHTWSALDGSFESGTLPAGRSHSVIFNRRGEYDFVCRLHPTMRGKIIVE